MGMFGPIGCGMWSLTPYDECDFRCLYCCTKVQGTSRPAVAPAEFLTRLRQDLDSTPWLDLVIVGAFCDAYPPAEEGWGLTRQALEELTRRRRRFVICTKSTTVLRDLDLLSRHRFRCQVYISICSADDAVLRRFDPGAPGVEDRLATLWTLHDAGIDARVNVLPWIPGITDMTALIARIPAESEIVVGPLAVGVDRDSMSLLGIRYTRAAVNELYMRDYHRYGHVPNTSWVRPSPPAPGENDPMYRLPVLAAPSPPPPASA
jgi:DNA repair photolyase